MLDELRQAAARQRANHHLRSLVFGCKRLLSERGETNSMAIARALVERIDTCPTSTLGDFFDYLSLELSPDPKQVLQAAQAYAEQPNART
jgi:malonyl-CoA decarboxylase